MLAGTNNYGSGLPNHRLFSPCKATQRRASPQKGRLNGLPLSPAGKAFNTVGGLVLLPLWPAKEETSGHGGCAGAAPPLQMSSEKLTCLGTCPRGARDACKMRGPMAPGTSFRLFLTLPHHHKCAWGIRPSEALAASLALPGLCQEGVRWPPSSRSASPQALALLRKEGAPAKARSCKAKGPMPTHSHSHEEGSGRRRVPSEGWQKGSP